VYDGAIAPGLLTPFFVHWYCKGAVPVAITLNLALLLLAVFLQRAELSRMEHGVRNLDSAKLIRHLQNQPIWIL